MTVAMQKEARDDASVAGHLVAPRVPNGHKKSYSPAEAMSESTPLDEDGRSDGRRRCGSMGERFQLSASLSLVYNDCHVRRGVLQRSDARTTR